MRRPSATFMACLGWLIIGCNQTTPVEEISIRSSGVAITNADPLQANVAWPGWRGPSQNGVAPDQHLATEWSDGENVRWRSSIPGRGHGSPAVANDLVLLATALDEQEQQCVLAYARRDGAQLWQTLIHEGGFPSSKALHKKGSNANGTVACDGARIYAVFLNAGMIIATALNLQGEILWQREVGAFDSKFGYAPSPILYRSAVIVAADNRGGGYLAALDGKSGEIVWRVGRPVISTYSSPVVAQVGGRDQLLISGCDRVAGYDPGTGGAPVGDEVHHRGDLWHHRHRGRPDLRKWRLSRS